MNKKDQLRQIIVDLIKDETDVLELKFGCEIRYKHNGTTDTIVACYGSATGLHYRTKDDNSVYYQRFRKDGNFEILGRPLNLADIFLAFDKRNPAKSEAYNKQEWDVQHFTAHTILAIIDKYNLAQPFDNQSDELYSFLLDILK